MNTETASLPASVEHWGSPRFDSTLKAELRKLKRGTLPLTQATTQGGMVDDSDISVSVLKSSESNDSIVVRASVFFDEIVGGCNCHDDPVSENAHCTLRVTIDKVTTLANFEVLADE